MAELHPAEHVAAEVEARLVRSVRWRLVAWSGGSTLIVLVVLGLALYLSVASSLAASGMAVLDDRAREIAVFLGGGRPGIDESPTDVVFGRGGTFAILIAPDGTAIGPRQFQVPGGLPDRDAVAAARAGGRDVRTRTVEVRVFRLRAAAEVPVRQLTVAADSSQGRYFVQVIQDRTAEVSTLQTLLVVLVVGGLVVVLVAVGFGAIYARRALVPIRDSLAAQRSALRRQREFAADASHELRTPLAVIRSAVELLRRSPARPVREIDETLEDIDAEVRHLTGLVDDLLLLARSDSGAVALERMPLSLDEVAAEAAASLARVTEGRGVVLVVDPEPVLATGDPARLRQLLTILLDNAIRHGPPGSEIRLTVRGGPAATVIVDDAGPGVPPEHVDRVFDRFWRAPGAPPGGTGLGLSIAREIAEAHGGSLSVGTSPAGGARFTFHLPTQPASL